MSANIGAEYADDQIAEAIHDNVLLVIARSRIDHAEYPQPTCNAGKFTDFSFQIG